MSTLRDLFHAVGRTDKHTVHDYDFFYSALFRPFREAARNVLELGTAAFGGGSLEAFGRYFSQAQVHGVDTRPLQIALPNVVCHQADAYSDKFWSEGPLAHTVWDVVVDDGPHTVESQVYVLNTLRKRLSPSGLLVVEDVLASNVDKILARFEGDKRCLSVVDRQHASRSPYDNEILLLYMTP